MANSNTRKRAERSSRYREIVTAILVDGAFYRKRAARLFGQKEPEDRADELLEYCRRHIRESHSSLYRIFYYDCPPSDKTFYHPLTRKHIHLGKTEQFKWMTTFLEELTLKRKVALRRGDELDTQSGYMLKSSVLKDLCSGKRQITELTESDFFLDITQKGVDMRIGIDVASLAERGIINQIVLISADSDFVPVTKYARRAGLDVILDPMWANVSTLFREHVDGLRQCVRAEPHNQNDPLHISKRQSSPHEEDDPDEDVLL